MERGGERVSNGRRRRRRIKRNAVFSALSVAVFGVWKNVSNSLPPSRSLSLSLYYSLSTKFPSHLSTNSSSFSASNSFSHLPCIGSLRCRVNKECVWSPGNRGRKMDRFRGVESIIEWIEWSVQIEWNVIGDWDILLRFEPPLLWWRVCIEWEDIESKSGLLLNLSCRIPNRCNIHRSIAVCWMNAIETEWLGRQWFNAIKIIFIRVHSLNESRINEMPIARFCRHNSIPSLFGNLSNRHGLKKSACWALGTGISTSLSKTLVIHSCAFDKARSNDVATNTDRFSGRFKMKSGKHQWGWGFQSLSCWGGF